MHPQCSNLSPSEAGVCQHPDECLVRSLGCHIPEILGPDSAIVLMSPTPGEGPHRYQAAGGARRKGEQLALRRTSHGPLLSYEELLMEHFPVCAVMLMEHFP